MAQRHREKNPQAKVTRRVFLQRSAATAAALAATQYVGGPLAAFAQSPATRLKFGLSTPIRTLDPRMSDTIQNDAIADTIYDQPMWRQFSGDRMQLTPRLATSWEYADKQTVVLKLRRGATFANGEPVNAEAVKYSLDTVYQRSYGAVRSYLFPNVESVQVVDDATVRVRAVKADRTLVNSLTGLSVLPPRMAAQLGREMTTRASGSGPYQPEEFTPGQSLKLRANDRHWGPKPQLPGIDIQFIVDDGTRVAALLAGDAHVINNLPVDQIDRVMRSDRLAVRETTTARVVYIGMRQDRGPLKDVRVRQAFNYAIDKESIVKNVLRGHAKVANSPIAPMFAFANPNLKPYPYDPARAKTLLSQAGYPSNFTVRFACPTGRYLGDRATGEAVAGYLSEIGVKVEFESPEWGVLAGEVFSKGAGSKYDIWLAGQGTLSLAEDSILRLRFHSDYNKHWMAYENADVDALIDAGAFTIDDNHARLIYYKAQERIMADAPWIFLHYVNSVFGVDRRLRGFGARPDEFIFFHEAALR